MSYKSLLACIGHGAARHQVIGAGLLLAQQFSAHLTALHLDVSGLFARTGDARFPGWSRLQAPAHEQEQARERAAALRAELEQAAGRAEVASVEWRSGAGELAMAAARHARYADLVIMGQHAPRGEDGHGHYDSPAEVALLSGRPVLVLPYAGRFERIGTRVLLAWNGTLEATRAATEAMPLLEKAEAVDVVVVDDGGRGAEGARPGADVALYLARHGLKPSVTVISRGGLSEAEALLSAAADRGADLLCMGAYGHSRLRELAFGGVTFEMMRHMIIPTLIAR